MIGRLLLRALYRLAPPTLHRQAAALAASMKPRVVVDIGSANALLARALGAEGHRPQAYIALDPDQSLLRAASPSPVLERVQGVAEKLPLRSHAASLAVLHDSLHHVDDPGEALREAARAAECLLVDDIDPGTPAGRLIALLERLVGFPARFMAPDDLARELEEKGLRVQRVWKDGRRPAYRIVACW